MKTQRPTGVTILAVLAAIGGVLGLLGACTLFGAGLFGAAALSSLGAGGAAVAQVGFMTILSGILILVSSVLDLAFAYGAWFLKPWGWMLGIVSQGFSIFVQLVYLVTGSGGFFSFLISVAISGVIIYYLMTPDVKKAFGRA